MDLALDAACTEVRDAARRLAVELFAPQAAELDATGRFPTASFQALGEAGLLGLNVPARWGGREVGVLALAVALTEVARVCPSTAVGMSVTHMVAETIARFGSDELAARYVPALVSGAAVAGAFCLSETTSGSDAATMATTARREADGSWVLDGAKMWITSGAHAGALIVMARTGEPGSGHRGISAFVVEPGFPGFSVGRPEAKAGLKGSNTVPLAFDGCRVPAGNLLGREGQGFAIAMTALDGGRITIGAMANGMARATLEAIATHAARAAGSADAEAAGPSIADIATELSASELMVWRAARLKEDAAITGRRFTREAAMAKLFATEACKRATLEGVRVLGEAGTRRAAGVERIMRDARVATIFEGTSEIQKLVIARQVLAS